MGCCRENFTPWRRLGSIRALYPPTFARGNNEIRLVLARMRFWRGTGRADVRREGRDVTLVAFSKLVHAALKAAELVSQDGISAEVIDPRSLSPLDEETILGSVRKTHRFVVADEDNPRCGIAADVLSLVARKAFDYLDAAPQMVTPPHTPVPFSPTLEDYYVPDPEMIADAIRATVD